ncbi:hypothetical protein M413DRAFT_437915 [Hebeloma cylindrosporum]|uniref:MYND-type domain-containing protein n=1 Tax=Hebeloma cylindrosporum TaxID=76867 RepID=A0A0C2YG90_HEBCY|nr:hypothetical protein M413DRAFT_437915 [Hebeloma cylindrosporum h7]
MAAYAQIITHTPEQTLQWRQIAISNPGRVARTIVLQPGQTTREGDNQGDIYPALEVVKEIALNLKNQPGERNKIWVNLVNAGIAEALCKNVCEMVVFFQTLPNMPQDLLKKVTEEMPSPYFAPLNILCLASVNFQYPPSKTDKRTIAALRKNWSEMMDRIWNEPESTLRPEDSHTMERMVVAQMLLRIIITDPTFISVLYQPSDLTIQIIARHWKWAQGPVDTTLTASTLYLMLEPNHPRQIAYMRSSGLESATSKIISKILVGVSPTGQSSKQQQARTLIATFAEHLVRLTGRDAANEVNFLMGITTTDNSEPDPEIMKVLPKATPLWNAMFRLLKKSAKPGPATDQGSRQDPETEKMHRLRVISNIVGASANTLHHFSLKNPEECEPLVRIWGNENFLGALEETIEILVKMPGMTMQLSRLAGIIESTISEGTPSLLRLFRTQFPRWRILGVLIRHDIERQQITGPPPAPIPGVVPASDSHIWDHGVWQCFGSLQLKCMDKTACGKRGCEKPGTIACMCEATKYCSEACKTKDAKDHRLACGFLGLLDNVGITGEESAKPTKSPPSQPTKVKKTSRTAGPDSASLASLTLEDLD